MCSNKIFIFSDESGCWTQNPNNAQYYIRSWIKLEEESLESLNEIIGEILNELNKNIKEAKNIKELCWDYVKNNALLKNNYEKYLENLFGIYFQTFITVSVPSCANQRIKETNTYKVISEISEESMTGYISISKYKNDKNLAKITKDKLIKTVEHMLFIGIYEKYHIENAKKAFDLDETMDYEFIIDNPQCDKEMWKDIANIEKVKTEDSKNNPGIQLADIVAGCYQDLLKDSDSDEYKKAIKFQIKYLKSKQINKGKELPNPNVIFANDECVRFVKYRIKRNIWYPKLD